MSEELVITKTTKLKTFSREDFERVILANPNKDFYEKVAELEANLGIEIPESVSTLEDLIDYTYGEYSKVIEEFELNKLKLVQFKSNKRNITVSKKDWIIQWIDSNKDANGIVKYDALFNAVDEFFGYSAQGKTPRTRIKRVLLELVDRKLIAWVKGEIHVNNTTN